MLKHMPGPGVYAERMLPIWAASSRRDSRRVQRSCSQTGSYLIYLSYCSAVRLATGAGNGRGVWSQLEQVFELGMGICLVLEIN